MSETSAHPSEAAGTKYTPDEPGWYECRFIRNGADYRVARWWDGRTLWFSPRAADVVDVREYTEFIGPLKAQAQADLAAEVERLRWQIATLEAELSISKADLSIARACKPDEFTHLLASERLAHQEKSRAESRLAEARKVLAMHHTFHKTIGSVDIPVESMIASLPNCRGRVDLSARYAESELCKITEALLPTTQEAP